MVLPTPQPISKIRRPSSDTSDFTSGGASSGNSVNNQWRSLKNLF